MELVEGSTLQERIDQLTKLTERYCVVFQTLAKPPAMSLKVTRHG